MELCSFWVISPADGQEGRPEPVKLIFYENGDISLISISDDPDYRGAYKLPAGSYSYTGKTLSVSEENLGAVITLAAGDVDEQQFRSRIFSLELINNQEWNLFYASPRSWKSLRIVAVSLGE